MKNKIVFWGSVALCFLVVLSGSAQGGLNDGLVGHWDFDNDSGNIVTDSSGQNNHGTIIGATLTEDRFGNLNKAYFFDGGDYIDVPNADSLNPTSAITITAWFKADSFALGTYSWPPIVKKSDNNQTSGYTLELCDVYESHPGLWGGLNLEGYGRLGPLKPYPPVAEGTWYFAALVFDGSTLTNYLRSMGQTSFTTASNNGSGNIVLASNNLNIGRDPSNTYRFFHGAIDDVRIYNRALTTDEVIEVYNVPEPDPIQKILDFIEKSVADGTLVPVKPGKPGEGQLGALINMIETADELIKAEDIVSACGQLNAAFRKTDGQERPPDFVTGEAVVELASMIQELMTELGCQ